MSIDITCGQCQANFRVKDEFAGRTGKCPHCGGAIRVPALEGAPAVQRVAARPPATVTAGPAETALGPLPSPAAASPTPAVPSREAMQTEVRQRLRLHGAMQPVRLPWSYRFGLVLAALVMMLLVVCYVAMIAGVGYLTYLHTVSDTGIITSVRGRAMVLALGVYLAPIVAGAVLTLFMLKPLFARPADQGRTRSLTRSGEPLLFEFVDFICAAVGAPQPRQIDVDAQVNASASFRRGLWSMLGNDLVLTIGLPLVRGLELRQFAGVLAHEFGHFSQGAGMRLTYLVRTISMWFTRVVYERDEWDERLVAWSRELDIRIGFIFYFVRFCVWLTRRVLWVLMMIGHAVAGFLLRQMEFDADRYETRLVGSQTFAKTDERIALLSVASQAALNEMATFYREGRLGDDLPRLVVEELREMPEEIRQAVLKENSSQKTGWFDTHPASPDRVASATRENTPGIFGLNGPTAVLFNDLDALSRNVTWDFYRGIFGPEFKPSDMHPLADLLARKQRDRDAGESVERFFQGHFNLMRPLSLPGGIWTQPTDVKVMLARLAELRQRLVEQSPRHAQSVKQYVEADTTILHAAQATAIAHGGIRLRADMFPEKITSPDSAREVARGAKAGMEQARAELAAWDEMACERARTALELLLAAGIEQRLPDAAALQGECERLLPAAAALAEQQCHLLEIREARAELAALLAHLKGNEQNQGYIREVHARMDRLARVLGGLHQRFGLVDYPFDHAKGEMTLAKYAFSSLPAADDLGRLLEVASEVVDKLPDLYTRIGGRLAAIGERAEAAFGLPPLPAPPKEKSEVDATTCAVT